MEGALAVNVRNGIGFIDHGVQDEAYELGYQWAKIYEPGSKSRKLIVDILDNALLVNIVHNDFHDRNKIFQPFSKLEEELGAQTAAVPNGIANGHAVVANGHAN
jgi:methylenetetrahydrofolate reductase (NADPH)